MIDNGEMLKDVCDHVIYDLSLQPEKDMFGKIVRTHCNEAAQRIANALGCTELDGVTADEQYSIMRDNVSGCWRQVYGVEATLHALDGKLAFAAMSSAQLHESHGHIAAIYPVSMQRSGSLGKDVPMVANVGTQNGEVKVSQAFPPAKGEPEYYTWTQEPWT